MATPITHPATKAESEIRERNFPILIKGLAEIIGKKFTAYVGSVSDANVIAQWSQGQSLPPMDVQERLRLTYRLARTISLQFDSETAQAWLQGLNSDLGDQAPLTVLREQDVCKVRTQLLTAADAFIER